MSEMSAWLKHGRAACSQWPVTEVFITDKVAGNYWFKLRHRSTSRVSDFLPGRIFRFLPGCTQGDFAGGGTSSATPDRMPSCPAPASTGRAVRTGCPHSPPARAVRLALRITRLPFSCRPGQHSTSPAPMARPTNLTPELIVAVCKCIEGGNFRDQAAKKAGIPIRTFRRWCARGKKARSGIYAEFWHAVLAAEAAAETSSVEAILAAGKVDVTHLKWWLERKHPERWGRDRLRLKDLERRMRELEKLGGNAQELPAPPAQNQA